ncbi:MAG: energy transducer TonB [Deltaproteobacteria bacterium]|nr:energy transducer TonB [Deltaproteobacteria bacterium]
MGRGFSLGHPSPVSGSGGTVFVEILTEGPPQILSQLPSGSGTGSSTARGSGSGDGSGSDPVLSEIRSRIERAKHYPHLAQKTDLEGVVSIRFRIDEQGRPISTEILKSSGSSLLDQAAVISIQRGSPFPRYERPISLSIRYQRGS